MDRQTDMTKLLVAFHNFVNVPKNIHTYQAVSAHGQYRTVVFFISF